MHFIGIGIALPRPVGQKISGCELMGFDSGGVAICTRYLRANGEIVPKAEHHYTAAVGCKLFRAGTVWEK